MNQTNNNRKVLIMAGGTGGHVFPALSIAKYLLSKGLQVEWLGTRNGLESRIIGETDIPIHYISISGLRGKSIWKKLLAPFVILLAVIQSMIKVLTINPACVLGMGGFVTGPGGLAAWLLRRPLLIHEQNVLAGFTNQMLFPLAGTVMEAFPGSFQRKQEKTTNALLRAMYKQGKAVHVGNPVRAEISACPEPAQRFLEEGKPQAKLKILIIGGSLGAVAINKVIPELLSLFTEENRPEVVHQCGDKNLDETREYYSQQKVSLNDTVRVQKFIEDITSSYCWADLVICRAGALTVSEIAEVGVPSVLIPYPYAVDDHQTENARVLLDAGAAWLVQQNKLNAEGLYKIIQSLIEDRKIIMDMALAAKKVACESTTQRAGEFCVEACYA